MDYFVKCPFVQTTLERAPELLREQQHLGTFVLGLVNIAKSDHNGRHWHVCKSLKHTMKKYTMSFVGIKTPDGSRRRIH